MSKKPRQDDIDPHKPYTIKELSQKRSRLAALDLEKRTTFVQGEECTVADLETDSFITGRVVGVGERLVRVQPVGDSRILVFDKHTRKGEGRARTEVYTQFEWERSRLFREEVLPKLEDLAQDYKCAGDMGLAELKVLSACLTLAINQREGKR